MNYSYGNHMVNGGIHKQFKQPMLAESEKLGQEEWRSQKLVEFPEASFRL